MLYILGIIALLTYAFEVLPKAIVILLLCISISGTILQLSLGEKLQLGIGFPPLILETLEGWFGLGAQRVEDSPLLDLVDFFEARDNLVTKTKCNNYNNLEERDKGKSLLLSLKRKLGKENLVEELIKCDHLISHIIDYCVEMKIYDDDRVSIVIDILNTICNTTQGRSFIYDDRTLFTKLIDFLLSSIDQFIYVYSDIHSNNTEKEGNKYTERMYQSSNEKLTKQQYVITYGYKFVVCLGLLAENASAQNLIGDRGSIPKLLKLLNTLKAKGDDTPKTVRWCCLSLINIIHENPPNKREFVIQSGVTHLTDILKIHASCEEVFHSALALLLIIISVDPHTKMNLANVRQNCLSNGIFDILNEGKKKHVNNAEIHKMTKLVLDLLISDWS